MLKPISFCLLLCLVSFAHKVQSSPTVTFVGDNVSSSPITVAFVDNIEELDGFVTELDSLSDGKITKLLALNEFSAAANEVLHLQMVAGKTHLLLVGSQQDDKLTAPELQDLGGAIAAALRSTEKDVDASIIIDNLDTAEAYPAAHIAYGYHLRDYFFDKYKAVKRGGNSTLEFITPNPEMAKNLYENDLRYIAEGVHLARDLAWEPGKSLYPVEFVDRVKEKLKGKKNLKVRVLDVNDMEKLNMGAILGVGQGSIHEPRLLIVEYMGGDKDKAPIALAGKGVTFDTGGISLKPNANMWQMKSDLSGAAAVAGTMYAIASRQEAANVVGLMPLAENMPAEDAIRPGDALDTMKGTTIEIISTDAEGRLLLSDAVYYAQKEYQPALLLNIATLTGSAVRALSFEYAALITRDIETSVEVMGIGKRSGEHVWPLPLHPNHFDQIASDIADIKNSGAGNPGASIGAAVIGTFVDEDQPWIHLDIAGVDWLEADRPTVPRGAQGWGVRFMDQLVREKK